MKNKKLFKKVVSFCEEINALAKKVDDAKDLIEEIKATSEEEGKDANFSTKIRTKLRKLNKQFSDGELIEDLEEVKVDADELAETDEFCNSKSFSRVRRSLKRFSEDMLELKGDISKASAAAASEVTPPEAPVATAPSASADSSASTDGNVVPVASVNDSTTEATDDSDGKIVEPESINFSKVRKMHVQKLFSTFEDICENCEDITEGIKEFTDDMVIDDSKVLDETLNTDGESLDEKIDDKVVEDKVEFCDDVVPTTDEVKKLENKVEELLEGVKEVMVKEGFCKEEKLEGIDKFKSFCDKLDAMVVGEASADELAESLEDVEFFCKNLSKKVKKFSSKKAFCGIMKAFDELPVMVDAIEISTSPVGTEDTPDDTIEKIDSEINAKIDDMDKIEKKITDENLVAFSQMTRKALKSMKCFSEEDIEKKSEQVNDLLAKLDDAKKSAEEVIEEKSEVVNESECPECGKDPCECEEKKEESTETTEESTEETKTEEFSEEDNAPAEESTEEVDEDVESITEPSDVEAAMNETSTEDEVPAEGTEEVVEETVPAEDTETTDVDEVTEENFSEEESESEDIVISNSDYVNDIMNETSDEVDAEVQESAPESDDVVANFGKKSSQNDAYGTWLARQASRM